MRDSIQLLHGLAAYAATLMAIALIIAGPELKEMFQDFKEQINRKP